MSIDQMREKLYKLYASRSWSEKVKNMSDKQVYAVYNRVLQETKRFNKK